MPDKAPVCPWCGAKMTAQRESTEMMLGNDYFVCTKCNAQSPKIFTGNGDWSGKQAAAYAAAMKRYEPMQKPLTVEEMEELGGDGGAVYVLSGSGIEEFAIVIGGSPSSPIDALYVYPCGGTLFNAIGADQETYDGDFYAMRDVNSKLHPLGWIAFRRKPTDEERKAAGWDE